MKSFFRRLVALVAVAGMVAGTTRAQDLSEQLSKLGKAAAPKYVAPFFSGLGNSLNSAFYHSADLHDILGFDVGVKLAFAGVEDADKSFTLDLPATMSFTYLGNTRTMTRGVDYPASITTSTAVGAKTGAVVTKTSAATLSNPVPAGTTLLELPGGFDLPAVGLPMPQVALGLPFGLEVIGRFTPTIPAGDAGKFNYSGFGIRYDVDQWLPLFPVDIAVHFATQKLNFKDKADKDIFTASGTAYGVEVSKRLLFITLYGGFQLESSKITLGDFVGYEPQTGATVTIPGFEVEGTNKSRATVGLRMLLLIVNVHAEYSFATNPMLAAGVGISIR